MKINYKEEIMNLDGKPFLGDDQQPVTLKSLIVMSCSMPLSGDDQISALDKYKVGEVAFLASKEMDLVADQVVIAKARIAKGFQSPVLIYVVHNLLEGVE